MQYSQPNFRELFPIFKNLPSLVYLDNAATTQKPLSVIEAINKYYLYQNSNTHSNHSIAVDLTKKCYEVRKKIQKFINAKFTEEIIFTKGATEGINLVAKSLSELDLKVGDEILVSEMEHHANLIPWQLAVKSYGASLKFIPVSSVGELNLTIYPQLINSKTRIVAVTMASNVLGTINSLEEIIQKAHKVGAKVIVDACQAAPHLVIDVQKLDVDFLVFSAHKMYGPTGIGVLYGKKNWLEKMQPYQVGGDMVKSVSFQTATFAEIPEKFEAGTQNFAGIIGFGAAIEFLEKMRNTTDQFLYENYLLKYTEEKLLTFKNLKIFGTSENKLPIISFNIENIDSYDLAMYLDIYHISVRAGKHCAEPLLHKFGLNSTCRLSLATYNTEEEISFLIEKIKDGIKILH